MKRFFTFLMAVWALLSISQTGKATNTYYVRGAFKGGDWPAVKSGLAMTPKGNNTYVLEYKSQQDGEFRFRFTGDDLENEMCPAVASYDLTRAIPSYGVHYTNEQGMANYCFYVNMESGKTYTFTFDNSNPSNRTVACTVGGSSSPSEFEKLYLIGGLFGDWKDDKTRPFTTTDGKIYKYVFNADYTNTFSKESDDYYFRVKTESDEFHPENNDAFVETTFTSALSGSSNNAWKLAMTKGKSYTLIFDKDNKQIKYTEGGSSVVTKVIKLFNGSSEVTGSNGKYTLDLSGETSTDATITLDIDGTTYGLATAQAISTVGTTSDIAFTAEGKEALTLKAGLIYSLSVTEDGKMIVVAEEKVDPYTVYDAGFYLVGDFMSQYNDKTVNPGGDTPGKINYKRLYFKFEQQKDGSYKIDIPACLTAKMQILGISVDGVPRVYGPVGIKQLHGPSATEDASPVTNGVVGGVDGTDNLEVVNGFNDSDNYWNLENRNNDVANADGLKDDDGSYVVSFKYDAKAQSPTTWTIKHDGCTRVAYLLSTAKGATAQPLYNKRSSIKDNYDDNLKAAIHLDGSNSYYVLGTVVRSMSTPEIQAQAEKANDGIHYMGNGYGTHNKLFFLGSEPKENVQSSNKLYGNQPAVVLPKIKGVKIIEVNPTRGNDTDASKNNSYGLQADFRILGVLNEVDYPDVISMVGPAIPSTTTTTGEWLWDATAGDMTYDESDRCYKLVLNTSDELKNKPFRFVGDHVITKNWYEDDTKANEDYPTSKEGFSDATVADPNFVNYVSDCTAETIKHDQDIIWNRGAGLWTVRFYIDVDKADKRTFRYTITGASKIYIPVTAHMGKLLRTYTSAVDVVPVNDDVQIFAAYSYEKGSKNETGYGDETGTVKLYRIKFIPANQGVVLFAPNSPVADGTKTKMEVVPAYSATVKRYSRDAYDYIEKWAESETKEDIWVFDHNYSEGQNKWNNYMIPVLADTTVTQFYYDENNEWSGRVFSFTRLSQTDAGRGKIVADSEDDYYGFFRAAGNVKASYSYLMLPKTVMTSNGQILGQIQDGPNKKEDIKNFSKSMVWFEGIDAPMDNETTGISELKDNSSNIDAAYYTLQGVKVVKPVKGIYIHQGKKVIVK